MVSLRYLYVLVIFLSASFFTVSETRSQETPYVVTYDHYLEEPGALEIGYSSTFSTQRGGPGAHAFWAEFEYGAKPWWTPALYLEGQTTFDQSTLFTGYRWENRFRPLKREHLINPVFYLEYENKNGADKILKEVEGHDTQRDFLTPNDRARQEHIHELELKLILSSAVKGWNFSGNILAAKNLSNHPWEFGYALGASHSLSANNSDKPCSLCLQNLSAGVELYGGLGDGHDFGLKNTSHYLAPAVVWTSPSEWTLRLSPGFGLNPNSHRFLLRFGVSHEIPAFGEMLGRLFGSAHNERRIPAG